VIRKYATTARSANARPWQRHTARPRTAEGKALGCFCKPLACHGDVIVDAIAATSEAVALYKRGAATPDSALDRRRLDQRPVVLVSTTAVLILAEVWLDDVAHEVGVVASATASTINAAVEASR
jgi:hypothetical protein